MKRKTVSIFLCCILINGAHNIYAQDSIKDSFNQMISNKIQYQQNPSTLSENEKETGVLEIEAEQKRSFIQPEGITNICSEIHFKTKCKEVIYIVDIGNLVNEFSNGAKLMNYKLDGLGVRIIDLKNSKTLTEDDYRVESIIDNQIKIRFTEEIVEGGSSYKISIYIPTTIGPQVIYGGRDINCYLNKYIKNSKMSSVKAVIETYSKQDDLLDEKCGLIEEVYSEHVMRKEYSISLSYMEIAKIY